MQRGLLVKVSYDVNESEDKMAQQLRVVLRETRPCEVESE